MGRRGKKSRKQDQRVNKQRRTNEEKRRAELRRRPALAKKAKARISRIAAFCEEGCVVSAHKEGTKPYSPHMFCPSGLVQKLEKEYGRSPRTGRWELQVTGYKIKPWEEMTSRFLRMVLRSAWVPKNPKTVLDQIIIATSENHGS